MRLNLSNAEKLQQTIAQALYDYWDMQIIFQNCPDFDKFLKIVIKNLELDIAATEDGDENIAQWEEFKRLIELILEKRNGD